jgi:hypothetical protein
MKHTSAPASAASFNRMMASSIPSTCAESVRPIITKSEPPGMESRAMTAARMRVTNSSRETTCFPSRCPQRFVCTWSSMCKPATPERAYWGDGARDHGRSAEASVCVRDDWAGWVETAHHLGALHKIVEGGNGQVGLTETRSGSGRTTIKVR